MVKNVKMFELGDMLSKEVYCNSNVSLRGGLGRFFVIFLKKAALTPFDHISHVFRGT